MSTAREYAFTILAAMIAASGCSMQSAPPPTDDQEDVDPPPQPTGCTADTQCQAPDGCSRGVCEHGVCGADPICTADETCDSYLDTCVPNTPPPPIGRGSIVCSDPTGSTQTTIVISNGILGNLIGSQGIVPDGNWRIGFGTGSVGTDTKPWVSDTASYQLSVTNVAALFNFSLKSPGGQEYWFKLNAFDVSGTCSHALDAPAITHVVPGGGTTGNGSVSCQEVGTQTYVTISGGILDHLFATVSPNSNWKVMFGYGGTDEEPWVSDSSSYLLKMPNTVTAFSFKLRSPGGIDYWFAVNEFNVTGGNCSLGTNEFRHTPPATVANVGTIRCRLWPDANNVVRREIAITPNSNGIIAGTVSEGSWVSTPESIKLDVSQQMQAWVTNTSTYYFYAETGLDDFNFIVIDNNDGNDSIPGGDYLNLDAWMITNETTVHGSSSCQRVGGGISIDNSPS